MRKMEFFTKLKLSASVLDSKKEQLYKHFCTAPDWLMECCRVEKLPPDTVFIREGEPVHTIYFILDGVFKAVDYRALGIEYEFAQFSKVYAMGGMEVIMDFRTYRTNLRTLDQCTAITLSKADFEKWLMTDIHAMRYEAKMMGEYLLEQGRLAREYLFLPGAIRLAKVLVQRYEKKAKNGVLTAEMSRQNMANETGFSIKTVSRAIRTLVEEDLITKNDKQIRISYEQYLRLKQMIEEIVAPATDEQDRYK